MIYQLDDNNIHEWGNLSKSTTCLPIVVWIKVKNSKNDGIPYMMFANNTSDTLLPVDLVPITVSDNPTLLAENVELKLSLSDLGLLRLWIVRNKENLLRVWEGEIDMIDFARNIL